MQSKSKCLFLTRRKFRCSTRYNPYLNDHTTAFKNTQIRSKKLQYMQTYPVISSTNSLWHNGHMKSYKHISLLTNCKDSIICWCLALITTSPWPLWRLWCLDYHLHSRHENLAALPQYYNSRLPMDAHTAQWSTGLVKRTASGR